MLPQPALSVTMALSVSCGSKAAIRRFANALVVWRAPWSSCGAPQQPMSVGATTSQLRRSSSRMVAALLSANATFITQLIKKPTRVRSLAPARHEAAASGSRRRSGLLKRGSMLVIAFKAGESGSPDGSELAKVKVHGPPMLIQANADMCFATVSGEQCFIVVSPQNGRSWWDGNDTAGMLAHALKTYSVDTHRVYVTGLSMGGGATWNLAASTEPNVAPARYWAAKIAAAAPITGASDSKYFHTGICQGIVGQHLPIWAFHGDADTTVLPPVSHAWVDKINGDSTADGYSCASVGNPRARLTMYPGVGHNSWTSTYDPTHEVEPGKNLYQWLLSFERP